LKTPKRIKVLTLGDHPFLPSGVGSQTKYMCEALLQSDKFDIISLGGAISHPNYQTQKTKEWEERWLVKPVNGYGDKITIRNVLQEVKPDILWFMTDPRFYEWLWTMDDEVRPKVPLVYYHVWDNFPAPKYNNKWYSSTDAIATISKVTSQIVQEVSPHVREQYIPHAVDTDVFKKVTHPEGVALMKNIRKDNGFKDKTVFFWNNRNARRKQSGTLLFWFKEFLDRVGHDKAALLMHTDINDPHGQPLDFLIKELGLTTGQIQFSTEKVSPQNLATMYNLADCTVNISDAEGFGLGTLESLACETPIVVNMTGGLQEQVTDGKNFFGIGIEPSSKAVIGSPTVPYIYEDRINKDEFIDALVKIHEMSQEERSKLGKAGREHVMTNYNFETFNKTWVDFMLKIHEDYGSWETRKGYKAWECKEL
jgi:glycosyltransferase involved in cell wall biosynthesis